MEKTNLENSSEYNNLETLQDEIDLKDLWNGILRKKKWLFLTAGIFFTGSVIFTVHARIFRPVFRGSFTLLIKDPMVSNNIEKSLEITEQVYNLCIEHQQPQCQIYFSAIINDI